MNLYGIGVKGRPEVLLYRSGYTIWADNVEVIDSLAGDILIIFHEYHQASRFVENMTINDYPFHHSISPYVKETAQKGDFYVVEFSQREAL